MYDQFTILLIIQNPIKYQGLTSHLNSGLITVK